MSVTVANIKTLFNTYTGDDSTDRISDSEKYGFITEATAWLLEELGNEHMVNTYTLQYLDGVNRYKVTTALSDLLIGADLRRDADLHDESFTRKSPREVAEEIGQDNKESVWAVERYDGDAFIVINHESEHSRIVLSTLDNTTDGGGTWTADTSGSDATNVTADVNEKKQGSGSLNFDIDVSQSGSNLATIYNPSLNSTDLSSLEDLGSWVFWVYIPDVTNFTSVRLYWSDETSVTPSTLSKYWSATVTTDINGSAFQNGWNRIKVDWADATKTGSPDSGAIVYMQIDFNYGAGQADDTDFRIDDIFIAQPERLTFHYVSWVVGENSGGTDLFAFTVDTDVPFFSGRYDQYKHAVAHKAASLAFYSPLRLRNEGALEESEAIKALDRYRKIFESSATREEKSFKIKGVNLRRRRIRRIRNIT